MQIFNNTLVFILSGFQPMVVGITIFPFIFSNRKMKGDIRHSTHEKIHLRQQLECLFVLFFIIYFGHYLYNRTVKRMDHMTAYRAICFEKEAYDNDLNVNYLSSRKLFSWRK